MNDFFINTYCGNKKEKSKPLILRWIFSCLSFAYSNLNYIFAVPKGGAIAQSVEQWTENPCVLGSIPSGTTSLKQ
jgi:hypothetical protein